MEACPEPLKPYLAAMYEVRKRGVEAITMKNRWSLHLRELEKSFEGLGGIWARKKRQAEIEAARRRAEEEERRCEAVKEECRRVEEEYIRQTWEYRIRDVPEARREEARALLREEQDAIVTAYQGPSNDGGHVGSIGGTFFGIERRIQEAQKGGGEQEVARLLPLRERAKEDLAKVEMAIEQRNERIAEIWRVFAPRLQALIDETSPGVTAPYGLD